MFKFHLKGKRGGIRALPGMRGARECRGGGDSFFTKRMLICDYIHGLCRLSVFPTFMCIPAAGSWGSRGLISLVMCTRSLRSLHTYMRIHTYIHTQFDSTTGQWGGRWGGADFGGDDQAPGVCACVYGLPRLHRSTTPSVWSWLAGGLGNIYVVAQPVHVHPCCWLISCTCLQTE